MNMPREGLVIIFQTMDELRIWAPIALREWLKRNRPPGRRMLRTGQVVVFEMAAQETASSSSPGGGA